MMPLTPENRALVAEGIQQMRVTARPGYIALAALAKADLSSITADGLSFSLIPRLNAAGRMADPKLALDLRSRWSSRAMPWQRSRRPMTADA